MITFEELHKFFYYNPETGIFTRLVRISYRSNIGDIAGCLNPNTGYIQIQINSKKYYANRLAVLYMTGNFPENDVDHIDGIRNNNKWRNLRECNNAENGQNQKKAHKNNESTGFLGVYPTPGSATFYASIMLNGKKKYLGTFKTKEEAHERYLKEKRLIHEFNTL